MWEKVKDKEREHTSSPAWVNSPDPTGESSSTSWKSRDLRRSSVFGPSHTAGTECLSPGLGTKPPLALDCWDWCELVTKEAPWTCDCQLPVLHWRSNCQIHQSWQCLCNGLGCEFRLWGIVSECTWLMKAIDADTRTRSKCRVSCFAFVFKYIWVGFSLF